MFKEYSTTLRQEVLYYDESEMQRWRLRDGSLVPDRFLNMTGPGLLSGYYYGEFVVQRYYESKGYTVFNNDFDLLSVRSKYENNNKVIQSAIGEDRFYKMQRLFSELKRSGVKIKEPDLVITKPEIFFIEVKTNKDRIRIGQDTFAVIMQEFFDIPYVIYKVLPSGIAFDTLPMIVTALLPEEIKECK